MSELFAVIREIWNMVSSSLAGIITLLTVIAGIVFATISVIIEWQGERRAKNTFSIERRRLTEVNLKFDYDLHLTPLHYHQETHQKSAFMVLRLPIENIGDGPVDLLGMLISARILSYSAKPEIGTRGRDVEWDDYQKYPWNFQDASAPFCGISTTKHIASSGDEYLRLASKEGGVLRRIDAVNNLDTLYPASKAPRDMRVMYRVFSVARGYPLGEILRQLGGAPPDPLANVEHSRLQFQTLAQPDYHRWNFVQQALFNLNHFAFRLALYDEHHPELSEDPLGVLATLDAWRIFLLYHWEFVNETVAAPEAFKYRRRHHPLPDFNEKLEKLNTIAHRELGNDLILPNQWYEGPYWDRLRKLREICRTELGDFIALWQQMRTVIEACHAYTPTPRTFEAYTDEGYPALIHHAPFYKTLFAKFKIALDFQQRWFALMKEGYLVSRPFPRKLYLFSLKWRKQTFFRGIPLWRHWWGYDSKDIPADPRILEPYVMRTYYFLSVVPAPREKDQNDTDTLIML